MIHFVDYLVSFRIDWVKLRHVCSTGIAGYPPVLERV